MPSNAASTSRRVQPPRRCKQIAGGANGKNTNYRKRITGGEANSIKDIVVVAPTKIQRLQTAFKALQNLKPPKEIQDENEQGGVWGETQYQAFNSIVNELVKHKLWSTDNSSKNVFLDFGAGFGRFMLLAYLASQLDSKNKHLKNCRFLGVDIVTPRVLVAQKLISKLTQDGVFGNDVASLNNLPVQIFDADFFDLPEDHPIVTDTTVVFGYDVWMYKTKNNTLTGNKKLYMGYAKALLRMPNLRAVITCVTRDQSKKGGMKETLVNNGFRFVCDLKFSAVVGLQSAMLFKPNRLRFTLQKN